MLSAMFLALVIFCSLLSPITSVSIEIGPVIGKVTHDTARILLEVDTAATVTMNLKGADGTVVSSAANDMQPNLAYIFKFDGLTPKTTYTVEVVDINMGITSRFRTLPANPTLADALKFAFVACNRVWYSRNEVVKTGSADDVWASYAAAVKVDGADQVDYAFHLGDQYYSDDWGPTNGTNEWARALKVLEGKPKAEWDSLRPDIIKIYQDGYKEAWNYPSTRESLANVPNLMMGDDHEMVDDVGDIEIHNDANSPEYYIIHAVRDLFMMYQWQLMEDVPGVHSKDVPYMATENRGQWTWGEYGFIMADNRYARYFQPVQGDATPFLTGVQWEEIDGYLAETGAAKGAKLMIAMAQIPIVLFDDRITSTAVALSEEANDLEGTWEYKEHKTEQVRLLNALREWTSRGTDRAVTLAGGDMHMGGYSVIEYEDTEAMQQIIVGPVSGDEKGSFATVVLNVASEMFDHVDDQWEFEHWIWRPRRNVGFLTTDATNKWKAKVTHLMSMKQAEQDSTGADVFKVQVVEPKEDSKFFNGAIKTQQTPLLVVLCLCISALLFNLH
eukprot:TRINITY_DN49314_c0_g1_i1.p1 TRINITY_DN49314_c0_g1~~TRINITY_DN49314_c0_g1_i1.p1  ORF type:complete len:558 (-),score=54.68 TRINITY_DN49314_c0_g1_i1:94-1767(-)